MKNIITEADRVKTLKFPIIHSIVTLIRKIGTYFTKGVDETVVTNTNVRDTGANHPVWTIRKYIINLGGRLADAYHIHSQYLTVIWCRCQANEH